MKDSLLLALGELIRKEINGGELLGQIVDTMARNLSADRGTIFLLDEARDELVSVAAHLPEMEEIRVPLTEGVAGYVARTASVVNIPFCHDDCRFWREIDRATGYETKTMLAGPLHDHQGRLIGVVQFLNKEGGIFTEEDQQGLAVLSEQVAALLEETTLGRGSNYLPGELSSGAEDSSSLSIGEGFNQIVGQGRAMREVFRSVRRVAPLDATVLLRGESGTGKGLFARALHHNSGRRSKGFVQVDCTTLPEGLMENELFGHEKGAFTGADSRRAGKVELAEGGTLFLDEIGDLPLPLQGKLLTLLQEHTFCPVGGARRVSANIRIVTATNRDLERLVKEGAFREDLYYRLRVVQIQLPSLRERGREDLMHLINHFVSKYARRHNRPVGRVRADALRMLLEYPWPGNVRELENFMEKVMIFCRGRRIDVADLPWEIRRQPRENANDLSLKDAVERLEREYIGKALVATGGNRTQAAKIL
ncbi:MAG: sigma 54-interacting transcriptional regulator, partial [Bradymonadaceae bacterium]